MVDVALELNEVTRSYRAPRGFGRGRRLQAVRGVSLTVERGQAVGLVGESGCGKSTLARLAVGLERPDSGQVVVGGRELARAGARGRKGRAAAVQLIPQDVGAALDPRLTIGASIAEPLLIHRRGNAQQRRDRVAGLLSEVGLDESYAGRYPHQVSGGQRQRAVIARALTLEPEVLIADEPVAALDVSVRAQVLSLLLEIRRRRSLALLLISHDLAVLRSATERVDVMYLGRIVESGPTAEVVAAPSHPYTSALVAAFPEPDPRARVQWVAPRGEVPSPVDLPRGCSFAGRCPFAQQDCQDVDPGLRATGRAGLVACHHPLAAGPVSAPTAG